jgi:hypothetical protein
MKVKTVREDGKGRVTLISMTPEETQEQMDKYMGGFTDEQRTETLKLSMSLSLMLSAMEYPLATPEGAAALHLVAAGMEKLRAEESFAEAAKKHGAN